MWECDDVAYHGERRRRISGNHVCVAIPRCPLLGHEGCLRLKVTVTWSSDDRSRLTSNHEPLVQVCVLKDKLNPILIDSEVFASESDRDRRSAPIDKLCVESGAGESEPG